MEYFVKNTKSLRVTVRHILRKSVPASGVMAIMRSADAFLSIICVKLRKREEAEGAFTFGIGAGLTKAEKSAKDGNGVKTIIKKRAKGVVNNFGFPP